MDLVLNPSLFIPFDCDPKQVKLDSGVRGPFDESSNVKHEQTHKRCVYVTVMVRWVCILFFFFCILWIELAAVCGVT